MHLFGNNHIYLFIFYLFFVLLLFIFSFVYLFILFCLSFTYLVLGSLRWLAWSLVWEGGIRGQVETGKDRRRKQKIWENKKENRRKYEKNIRLVWGKYMIIWVSDQVKLWGEKIKGGSQGIDCRGKARYDVEDASSWSPNNMISLIVIWICLVTS